MSKEASLMGVLGNIKESMGASGRSAPAPPAAGPRPMDPKHVGARRSNDVYAIELDRIVPDPDQPRKEFNDEALARLAESLKTRGQLQPIQVRWEASLERYVVLMGERRWRAAQAAGLATLACVVRDREIDDCERMALQLVENCLREDLTPLDQARAYKALMDRQGWGQERLAAELSVSQGSVARALSMLRLPESVQSQVDRGAITPSHAHEIAKLDDPADQIRLATAAAEQGLTRDDVARQVRKSPSKKKAPAAKKLPAARVWRIEGYRLELARKAGVDPVSALAVLQEAVARLQAELAEATAEAA